MKRKKSETKDKDQIINSLIKANSTLTTRMQYIDQLGYSYNGNRDLYQALGYKKDLTFSDYYLAFDRGDIAKTIVEKVPKVCWSNKPIVKVGKKEEDSVFEKKWKEIVKKTKMFSVLLRLDKLLGLGEYGVLFYGFNDAKTKEDLQKPVLKSKKLDLLYLQPYSSNSAKIKTFDQNINSERYGKPVLYEIKTTPEVSNPQVNETLIVHYTRVKHVVEDALESDIVGTPRLKASFNRIQDVHKIAGGSAEMFWRGARPGYAAKADSDADFEKQDADALQDQFDEYEHNMRRWLKVQGIDIKALEVQVASPKEHIEVQLDLISVVTGIPKRILIGSERGELASTQDEHAWNNLVRNRMDNFCSNEILVPIIDTLILYGVLPEPEEEYEVIWPKTITISDKDKAEITERRMRAVKEYTNNPESVFIIPPEIFLREEMQYSEEIVLKSLESINKMVIEEDQDLEDLRDDEGVPDTNV